MVGGSWLSDYERTLVYVASMASAGGSHFSMGALGSLPASGFCMARCRQDASAPSAGYLEVLLSPHFPALPTLNLVIVIKDAGTNHEPQTKNKDPRPALGSRSCSFHDLTEQLSWSDAHLAMNILALPPDTDAGRHTRWLLSQMTGFYSTNLRRWQPGCACSIQ